LDDALKTFASGVNQIRGDMSEKLSEKGSETLSSLSKRTAKQGDSLKNELKTLQNIIQEAQSVMLQTGISQN
jgi:hypothetical protein